MIAMDDNGRPRLSAPPGACDSKKGLYLDLMRSSRRMPRSGRRVAMIYGGGRGGVANVEVDATTPSLWGYFREMIPPCVAGVNHVFVHNLDERCLTFRSRGLNTAQRPESPIHTAPVGQTWGLREFAETDPDGNNPCLCMAKG